LCDGSTCVCDPNLFDAQFYVMCEDGCFNTHFDSQHCGDCTTACTGGTECSASTCGCPVDTLDCGNGCEDISQNPGHCGSCGNACDSATQDCVNRQCQCKPGLSVCSNACVDRQTDPKNCGSCGNACGGMKTCKSGMCAN